MAMNNSALHDWFKYLVRIILVCTDSIQVLLSFPRKGIFIDPKIELQTKTVKQLKKMLTGHKTTKLKKDQLISLVLTLA